MSENLVVVPYYGGKNRPCLQSAILAALEPRPGYLEAFAGSAGILVNRPRARMEILNDIDGEIVNFFRCLRDRPDDLVQQLKLTPFSRAERNICIAALQRPDSMEPLDDIERARCWYAAVAMGHVGTIEGGMRSDPVTATTFARRINEDFERIAERLSGVYIESQDAIDLIAKYAPDPDWTIYCDPPYPYHSGGRGNRARYEVDNIKGLHERLLAAVQDAKAQIVISGYETALYEDALREWTKTVIDVDNSSTSGAYRRRAVEVLYANRMPQSGLFA